MPRLPPENRPALLRDYENPLVSLNKANLLGPALFLGGVALGGGSMQLQSPKAGCLSRRFRTVSLKPMVLGDELVGFGFRECCFLIDYG